MRVDRQPLNKHANSPVASSCCEQIAEMEKSSFAPKPHIVVTINATTSDACMQPDGGENSNHDHI